MAKQADIRIEKRYIEQALNQIKRDRNVPMERRSKRFCLINKDKHHYPPKYVLSQAHYHKTGNEPRHLHGGPETNNILKEMRYKVEPCKDRPECQNWLLK